MSSSRIFIETAWTANPDENNDLFDFYADDISLKKLANPETVQKGENDYNGSNLKLEWQWNHNPNNKFWSLTERDGYLRLTTANKATGLLDNLDADPFLSCVQLRHAYFASFGQYKGLITVRCTVERYILPQLHFLPCT